MIKPRVRALDLPPRSPDIMVTRPELAKDVMHIFTDGSCYPNPGDGGWATILHWNGRERELYGGVPKSTNNTMELTAILRGLEARKADVRTFVYTDSQYAVNALTVWHKRWQRNDWRTSSGAKVGNVGIIQALLGKITKKVSFVWLKGHNGHYFNERCDDLAKQGRLSIEKNSS